MKAFIFTTLFCLLLFPALHAQAQTKNVSGTVSDAHGIPLSGVTITIEGSAKGTISDFDGNYSIEVSNSDVLKFSFIGYSEINETVGNRNKIDVVMQEDAQALEEVVLLGSRSKPRTATDSPVPVDVFNVSETSLVIPQTNMNQMLNAIAPSFSSNVQAGRDGTDHIDPAQLRGLGPDQVLVLVNGKRRHTTALVNINGSVGRGSVGTDLNAIPSFAIDGIEVLRDGAAAQYGSDAISGVMNLGLKKNIGLSAQINAGGNLSHASNDHDGGLDGETAQVDLNYGFRLGNHGGFVNLTLSSQFRNPTYRAKEFSAPLYNGFNAIENRANEHDVSLFNFFDNIDNLNPAQTGSLLEQIYTYAPMVNYFDNNYLNQILSATTIPEMQSLLLRDFSDEEVSYQGRIRKDYNMIVGQSRSSNTQFFLNSELPLSQDWTLYAFGGYSYRHGNSGGFNRKPNQAGVFSGLYPNGFVPKIRTKIYDKSIAAGLKGYLGEWNVDFSNTLGINSFDYEVYNSENPSLKFASPTDFKIGGLEFLQNTINLDFNRDFDLFEGFNFAFGFEQRHENFKIKDGQPESYSGYDINGNIFQEGAIRPTDFFGTTYQVGSQVISGFSKENAVSKGRNSYATYLDVAVDFTDWFLVDGAARYEHYSDFGNTVDFKLASRLKLSSSLNFRFAGSTGFRAPSIHQIYFNTTSTYFRDGEIQEISTRSNDSEVARLFGIPHLKEETSQSLSAGFTYKIPDLNLTLTADGYFIKVKDRIQLTESFSRPEGSNLTPAQQELQAIFDNAAIHGVQFFANSIDTETKGLDFVIGHKYNNGDFRLTNDFAFNINATKRVGPIHSSDILHEAGLDEFVFSERSRVFLEESLPRTKASFSQFLDYKNLSVYIRNTYFGRVTSTDTFADGTHPRFTARVITDLSFGYKLSSVLSLTVGANNLFDVYPSREPKEFDNGGQFIYANSSVQFGMNGRYVFGKIGLNF